MANGMIYINRRDGRYVETVDETESRKEARYLVQEYNMSDPSAEYYISQRACADWN